MAIRTRSDSRTGTLHLYRRVPKRYEAVEERTFVWVSLHTDSMVLASAKAAVIWEQHVAAWEAKLAGDTTDSEKRFAATVGLAQARGFPYMRMDQVAKLPLEDLRDRFEAMQGFEAQQKRPDMLEAAALLGGAEEPQLTVTRALELYWPLARDKTLQKSDDQLRRWKNPRIKAIKNFVAVVGDKLIGRITAEDMLAFREWWMDRLEEEGLTANSANKDLVHLCAVLTKVNKMKKLGLHLPFEDLKLEAGLAKTRPPFSRKWIEEVLLAPKKLDSLNAEARTILLVMVNTGCRPSEVAALSANSIQLDHSVPHVSIEPERRQLKSKNAMRKIPLLGVSLSAIRAFPSGFPRYAKSSASLSATVNKFLRENGLMESPDHSLYSLRHSFEDRMLAAGIDDRIRRDLFGHALSRERYGSGATLEHMQQLLQAVAI